MTGPKDQAAAGGGQFRVGHADRERAIETLKDAFVQGRLTKDELDVRAGRAWDARTRAELDAVTAGVPVSQPAASPAAAQDGRRGKRLPGRGVRPDTFRRQLPRSARPGKP
jgi:hypothetical protein